MGILKSIFKSYSEREIKQLDKVVDKIQEHVGEYRSLSDAELRAKTNEFKARIANGESLDDILPEAFAACSEADFRVLGMRPYRVQLLGGIVLHQGRVAEMRTGEGKANPVDTPIPTPDGWRTVGDIKLGDKLFDRHGKPTRVTGIYPQGTIDTYMIYLSDGRKVKCAEDHLWGVYDRNKGLDDYRVLSTKQMIEQGVFVETGYRWSVPLPGAVQYKEAKLPDDPYEFGLKLISESVENFNITDLNIDEYSECDEYSENSLGRDLITIPDIYMTASVDQRWELIKGLMDAGGTVKLELKFKNRYNIVFTTTSRSIKDKFMELIYSVGFSCKYKAYSLGLDSNLFAVTIDASDNDKAKFFKFSRYIEVLNDSPKIDFIRHDRVDIIGIAKLKTKTEQVCFTVDNPEHLFLIGNYVVTHNTLVATLPAYLNALTGNGVHVVTVNDYLAKRDSEWMGKVYRYMGLSVGLITHDVGQQYRRAAYAADITYGTNNEFGFDYLRDNMALDESQLMQRGHNFAIVDEVDSILIDEARTPLIISGQGEQSTELYTTVDNFVKTLKYHKVAKLDPKVVEDDTIDVDYVVDEKARAVSLTARGIAKAERYFNIESIADTENTTLHHHINQAIRAHGVMQKDIDYTIKDNKIIIVDEFTGRLMFGRRYNEGLHQAIEAKEGVTVERESKTLATITLQNYFRLYNKVSGMTGTAMTEKDEFGDIYKLDIVEIPTNKPNQRKDHVDVVYKTEAAKLRAVVNQVKECNKKGQPVLIGTVSIEKSEKLSSLLSKAGIKHNVLNAKNHEKEAEIVAQAGKFGAVTVATNMAGRGTDIILGGNSDFLAKEALRDKGYEADVIAEAVGYANTDNQEILDARELYQQLKASYDKDIAKEADKVRQSGGLFIIGTERHESRRIDNQLRGRAGRQGDPGETRFYMSLEDDILRLFGADNIMAMFTALKLPEDMPINKKMLATTIENAQRAIESRNFQFRKHTLQYDDIMNLQREIIYSQRMQIINNEPIRDKINNMIGELAEDIAIKHFEDGKTQGDIWSSIREYLIVEGLVDKDRVLAESIYDTYKDSNIGDTVTIVNKALNDEYECKCKALPNEIIRGLERISLLRVVDEYWMEHIDNMAELKRGIGLRAYAQIDPVTVYKKESYAMFEQMVQRIKIETAKRILRSRVEVRIQDVEANTVA